MKTLTSIAGMAALGVALSLALVSPSAADPAGDGDAVAGGVLGFMAGAAVGSAADGGDYYYLHDGCGDYGPRRGTLARATAAGMAGAGMSAPASGRMAATTTPAPIPTSTTTATSDVADCKTTGPGCGWAFQVTDGFDRPSGRRDWLNSGGNMPR